MNTDSTAYIARFHPCPACQVLVANVARICHECGAEQPDFDAEAYALMVAQSQQRARERKEQKQTAKAASKSEKPVRSGTKPRSARLSSPLRFLFAARDK